MARTELAQLADGGGDAVGLLDAQFVGVAHDGAPARLRCRHGQHRQLVDHRHDLLAAKGGAAQLAVLDFDVGHRLAALVAHVVVGDRSRPSPAAPPRCRCASG
jgi:hypothetical protein